jgi:mannose-1-phosphate guanylyltransferase
LTNHLPKALLPVLNKSMLLRWLEIFAAFGVKRVVVNAHHLADQIAQALSAASLNLPNLDIALSFEETILGTGGGVKKAALGFSGPFFVINCDIFVDLDLGALARRHLENMAFATIATVNCPAKATVSVDPELQVTGLRLAAGQKAPRESARLCGLGALIVSPEFWEVLPRNFSDLIAELAKYLSRKVLAYPFPGSFWSDMGTVASYWELNQRLAQNRVIVGPGARIEGETGGFVILGAEAVIERGALVIDSVLWPGARVESGTVAKGTVVTGRELSGGEADGVWN